MMASEQQQQHHSSYSSWHGENSSPHFQRTSQRGSMRKLLPATPDMETQTNLAAKMIDKRTSTPKGNHSYGPFFLEYSLLAEYNLLSKQRMPGVYVIPSAKSPLVWFGVIFVRQGIYQEGVFRFTLHIPENYPDGDCPRLIFDVPVFHPIVNPDTNELDLKKGFHKWKRNVNHLWQVLLYARKIFYKIDPKDPLNIEASNLYEQNLDAFKVKVQENIRELKSNLYTNSKEMSNNQEYADDPHYIKFSAFNPNLHPDLIKFCSDKEKEKACVSLNDQGLYSMSSITSTSSMNSNASSSARPASLGMSFLEQGSLQIFSSKDADFRSQTQ